MKRAILTLCIIVIAVFAGFLFVRRIAHAPVESASPGAIEQSLDVLTGIGALKTKQEAADPQLAVIRAKAAYRNWVFEGKDVADGPCIAEDLMPDWVADIAHNPRTAEDDLPQNQCLTFREGKAHHFVELDPSGNIIQIF